MQICLLLPQILMVPKKIYNLLFCALHLVIVENKTEALNGGGERIDIIHII